jgi:hypothetical protein
MSDHSPTPWRMHPVSSHPKCPKLWPAIVTNANGDNIGTFYIADDHGQGIANARLILDAGKAMYAARASLIALGAAYHTVEASGDLLLLELVQKAISECEIATRDEE